MNREPEHRGGDKPASLMPGGREAVAPRVDSRTIVEATQDRWWFTTSGLLTESVLFSAARNNGGSTGTSRPFTLAGSHADTDTAVGFFRVATVPLSSSHRNTCAYCPLQPQRWPRSLIQDPQNRAATPKHFRAAYRWAPGQRGDMIGRRCSPPQGRPFHTSSHHEKRSHASRPSICRPAQP